MVSKYCPIDFFNDGPDYRKRCLHTENVKFKTLEYSTYGLGNLGFEDLSPGSSLFDGLNLKNQQKRRKR